jgi:hypothetical protein
MLEDVKGLIFHMAKRYRAEGHFAMETEELEAEGLLVYAEVLYKYPQLTGNDFIAMFKTCLYNHLRSILDKYRYNLKRGYTVSTKADESGDYLDRPELESDADTTGFYYMDLSEVAETLGADGFEELYYNNYVGCLREMLKDMPDALTLFETMIDPPLAISDLAVAESRRKAHILAQGFMVKGVGVVKIKQKHICKYLGWSLTKLTDNLSLLRPLVSQIILGTESSFAV